MLNASRMAVIICVLFPVAAAAQVSTTTAFPVAYFSVQRAFAASPDGKAAQTRLLSLQAERTKEIEARNLRLRALQDTLERSASVLEASARRAREQEIERFNLDLNRFIEDAQAEFLGVQQDLESAFLTKVRPALDAVATDRGLLLVINEDAGLIAWADPGLDITPEVVARLQTQP